jgi:Fic family protein
MLRQDLIVLPKLYIISPSSWIPSQMLGLQACITTPTLKYLYELLSIRMSRKDTRRKIPKANRKYNWLLFQLLYFLDFSKLLKRTYIKCTFQKFFQDHIQKLEWEKYLNQTIILLPSTSLGSFSTMSKQIKLRLSKSCN